jgi:hypothetical protein
MMTIEIDDPNANSITVVLCKLIDAANKKVRLGGPDLQKHFANWMKEQYGYNVTFSKKGKKFVCHIDTSEVFFILKHC